MNRAFLPCLLCKEGMYDRLYRHLERSHRLDAEERKEQLSNSRIQVQRFSQKMVLDRETADQINSLLAGTPHAGFLKKTGFLWNDREDVPAAAAPIVQQATQGPIENSEDASDGEQTQKTTIPVQEVQTPNREEQYQATIHEEMSPNHDEKAQDPGEQTLEQHQEMSPDHHENAQDPGEDTQEQYQATLHEEMLPDHDGKAQDPGERTLEQHQATIYEEISPDHAEKAQDLGEQTQEQYQEMSPDHHENAQDPGEQTQEQYQATVHEQRSPDQDEEEEQKQQRTLRPRAKRHQDEFQPSDVEDSGEEWMPESMEGSESESDSEIPDPEVPVYTQKNSRATREELQKRKLNTCIPRSQFSDFEAHLRNIQHRESPAAISQYLTIIGRVMYYVQNAAGKEDDMVLDPNYLRHRSLVAEYLNKIGQIETIASSTMANYVKALQLFGFHQKQFRVHRLQEVVAFKTSEKISGQIDQILRMNLVSLRASNEKDARLQDNCDPIQGLHRRHRPMSSLPDLPLKALEVDVKSAGKKCWTNTDSSASLRPCIAPEEPNPLRPSETTDLASGPSRTPTTESPFVNAFESSVDNPCLTRTERSSSSSSYKDSTEVAQTAELIQGLFKQNPLVSSDTREGCVGSGENLDAATSIPHKVHRRQVLRRQSETFQPKKQSLQAQQQSFPSQLDQDLHSQRDQKNVSANDELPHHSAKNYNQLRYLRFKERALITASFFSRRSCCPSMDEVGKFMTSKGWRSSDLKSWFKVFVREWSRVKKDDCNTRNLSFTQNKLRVVPGLDVGSGIFAEGPFVKGEFVCPYDGKLYGPMSRRDAEGFTRRADVDTSYMMLFRASDSWYVVDGKEGTELGRLVNHSAIHPNVKAKLFSRNGNHSIEFWSITEILPGEEILVDYNERSAETGLIWLDGCTSRCQKWYVVEWFYFGSMSDQNVRKVEPASSTSVSSDTREGCVGSGENLDAATSIPHKLHRRQVLRRHSETFQPQKQSLQAQQQSFPSQLDQDLHSQRDQKVDEKDLPFLEMVATGILANATGPGNRVRRDPDEIANSTRSQLRRVTNLQELSVSSELNLRLD
ncbi:unnamed protein product [Cyprideis torosa]|uniref:Uncharacterized protein n=1 Tax=Cyprideis torosa TaxID=163714 RepID=A0A7R8WE90_9CRUS|nr:unnamed protein product [Cyprideis torosa]CAG0894102.1 unnamed protein product [Cyprideis torosa]